MRNSTPAFFNSAFESSSAMSFFSRGIQMSVRFFSKSLQSFLRLLCRGDVEPLFHTPIALHLFDYKLAVAVNIYGLIVEICG